MFLKIKIVSKKGEPLDEADAWQALVDCFAKHPSLDIHQAITIPDYDGQKYEE